MVLPRLQAISHQYGVKKHFRCYFTLFLCYLLHHNLCKPVRLLWFPVHGCNDLHHFWCWANTPKFTEWFRFVFFYHFCRRERRVFSIFRSHFFIIMLLLPFSSTRKWEPATILGVIRSLTASRGREFLLVEIVIIYKMQNKLKSMQKINKFKASLSSFEWD